jgi:hypothetical protein
MKNGRSSRTVATPACDTEGQPEQGTLLDNTCQKKGKRAGTTTWGLVVARKGLLSVCIGADRNLAGVQGPMPTHERKVTSLLCAVDGDSASRARRWTKSFDDKNLAGAWQDPGRVRPNK